MKPEGIKIEIKLPTAQEMAAQHRVFDEAVRVKAEQLSKDYEFMKRLPFDKMARTIIIQTAKSNNGLLNYLANQCISAMPWYRRPYERLKLRLKRTKLYRRWYLSPKQIAKRKQWEEPTHGS